MCGEGEGGELHGWECVSVQTHVRVCASLFGLCAHVRAQGSGRKKLRVRAHVLRRKYRGDASVTTNTPLGSFACQRGCQLT